MRQLKITKSITRREDSMDKYLQEIGREERVDIREEIELATRIKDGDEKALNKLIRANLRFVVSVAKQYQNQGLTLPDLINEGNIGLIKAAQKFDETKGFKFISYAVWWIRQSILQALAETARLVRLPLNKIGTTNKLTRKISKLEQELGRSPTEDEISQVMEDTDPEVIEILLGNTVRHVSMDAPLAGIEDEINLYNIIPDDESLNPEEGLGGFKSRGTDINRVLSTLPEREKDIIIMFFGINREGPMTLEEIAEILPLTRERVRQLKEQAIRRLRVTRRAKILKKYLG
jgi:RNA polymerase primary sigma factor